MNMPNVPDTHTNTKIHRKRRSITMATYFQSSLTCGWRGSGGGGGGGCREKDEGEQNHSCLMYAGGLIEVKG